MLFKKCFSLQNHVVIGFTLDERLLKRIVNGHSSFIKLDLLSAHQFGFSLLSSLQLSVMTQTYPDGV